MECQEHSLEAHLSVEIPDDDMGADSEAQLYTEEYIDLMSGLDESERKQKGHTFVTRWIRLGRSKSRVCC
jgi:hypothetical protein